MKLLLLSLLFAFGQTCSAQIADNTNRHNDNNIYFQALKQYLEYRATDTFYSKLDQIDTLFIYQDSKIIDSLLSVIGTTKIIMVGDPYTFLKSRNEGRIVLYSIFPLAFENGEFSVSFVPFGVKINKKRKKNLNFSNPGSYKVVFAFEKRLFHFVRLEDHGI